MPRALVAVLIAVPLLLGVFLATRVDPPAPPPRWLPPGGDFTLQSADGPVALADLRGSVVLIYFGYASCPDVCPTSLGHIAQAFRMLTPQELARTRAIFVSVDPARDTPALLKQYTAHFDDHILGVTGTAEAIAEVAARYGAAYRIAPIESASGYAVDHTSFTSVVGPDGNLLDRLSNGTPPAQIVDAVRRALSG